MTDKEFKQLNRSQLVEIIYQFQLKVEELTEQNESLQKELEDKRIRIEKAGSIAEAALEINECFRNAQKAADLYLNEIKEMRRVAEAEREKILAEAHAEAEKIVANAQKKQVNYTALIEAVLVKYAKNQSNNG